MKKHLLIVLQILAVVAIRSHAGTLSCVPIAPPQSDVNSGISNANQYTTAIDGGNARGAARVINGIKLSPLVGSGSSATADNCSVNALSGTLNNASMSPEGVQADGSVRDVMADVVINTGATDNSQQEIVLDPESLEAGGTYDLRVYFCKSGDEDRQVNLAFVGDGQAAAETGFFNEDDARTTPCKFQDPTQVYYINYRFTWDGESTPGITITQKSGQAPFVLYALTNQPVAVKQAAAPPPAEGGQGINMAQVATETAEPDQVGVTSDTFYSDESLNKNGRWIGIKKYGRCWQPTGCPTGWRPYTRGTFRHNDEGGWTWVSDASEEEWGWATYHYGRWARVDGVGCGWAWVPGTVWSGAWVSWRNGQTPDCTCVGWAPLPPETRCDVNVGVSRWVDKTADIGPDNYTFVHVRDFGSDNYDRCGCVLERKRYVNIIEHTVNITNISYTRGRRINVYNGGPDLSWCNTEIRRGGGREIVGIRINLFADPGRRGGRGKHWEGDTLNLFSPRVIAVKNSKFLPKIAINVPNSKVDRGWNHQISAKQAKDLRFKIANQTKGETPETTKATAPGGTMADQGRVFDKDGKPLNDAAKKLNPGGIDPQQPDDFDLPLDAGTRDFLKTDAAKNGAAWKEFQNATQLGQAAQDARIKANKNPGDEELAATAAAAEGKYTKANDTFKSAVRAENTKAMTPDEALKDWQAKTGLTGDGTGAKIPPEVPKGPGRDLIGPVDPALPSGAAWLKEDTKVGATRPETEKLIGPKGPGRDLIGPVDPALPPGAAWLKEDTKEGATGPTGPKGAVEFSPDLSTFKYTAAAKGATGPTGAIDASTRIEIENCEAAGKAAKEAIANANADPTNGELKAKADAAEATARAATQDLLKKGVNLNNPNTATGVIAGGANNVIIENNEAADNKTIGIENTKNIPIQGAQVNGVSKSGFDLNLKPVILQDNAAVGNTTTGVQGKTDNAGDAGKTGAARTIADLHDDVKKGNIKVITAGEDPQIAGKDPQFSKRLSPGQKIGRAGKRAAGTGSGQIPIHGEVDERYFAPIPKTASGNKKAGQFRPGQKNKGAGANAKFQTTDPSNAATGETNPPPPIVKVIRQTDNVDGTTATDASQGGGTTKSSGKGGNKHKTARARLDGEGNVSETGPSGAGKKGKKGSDGPASRFLLANPGAGGGQTGGGGGGKHKKHQQDPSMLERQGQTGGGGRGQRQNKQQGQDQKQQKQGGKKGKKREPLPPDPADLSDLRAKNNISFVGWSPMGIPIYQFSYINQPNKRYQGTIAQAITQIRPDAIIWRNGLMFVDYSKLDIGMTELP